VWNDMVSQHLQELLDEQDKKFKYRVDKKRISIILEKETLVEQNIIYKDKLKSRRKQLIASLHEETPLVQPAYDFLEEDDKDEVLRLCDDMSDIMYRAKNIGFQNEVLIHLRSCLSVLSLSLMSYPQFAYISNLMVEFSVVMNENKEKFKGFSSEEFSLIEGFVYNLDRWAETLFVTGGADLHFMDKSLKADLDMIKMLIEPQKLAETSTDDIFDF